MQPAFRSGRAQVRNALQCLRLPVAFLGCCTAVSVLEWQGGVAEGSAKLCSVNLLLCRCCGGRSVASVREEHSSRLRRSPPCRAAAARRGRVCVRVHAAALQPGADVPVGGCPAGRRRLGRPHLRHHGPPGIAAHTLRGGRQLLRVCRTTHMRARVSRLVDHAHMPEQRLTVCHCRALGLANHAREAAVTMLEARCFCQYKCNCEFKCNSGCQRP